MIQPKRDYCSTSKQLRLLGLGPLAKGFLKLELSKWSDLRWPPPLGRLWMPEGPALKGPRWRQRGWRKTPASSTQREPKSTQDQPCPEGPAHPWPPARPPNLKIQVCFCAFSSFQYKLVLGDDGYLNQLDRGFYINLRGNRNSIGIYALNGCAQKTSRLGLIWILV